MEVVGDLGIILLKVCLCAFTRWMDRASCLCVATVL